MFDYSRKMRLALSDQARRIGLKAAAGAVLAIGGGFLLSALWLWLAHLPGWGPLGASLAIGLGFVILGLLILVLAGRVRHRPPEAEELRSEVEERLALAADAVLGKVGAKAEEAMDRVQERAGRVLGDAQARAGHLVDLAGNRVTSLMDSVSYKADRLAGDGEARARNAARQARDAASAKMGLTPEQMSEKASRGFERARRSNLAAMAPVIGAFAVGLTLASRLQGWRHRDDEGEDALEEFLDDEFHDSP